MRNANQPFGQSNPFDYSSYAPVAQASGEVRMEFLRKTYSLFMAGIVCALLMGAATLRTPALYNAAVSIPWLFSLLLLVGLSLGAQAVSRIEGVNYVALFVFTAFIGWRLTPMLQFAETFQPGILGQAGALTAIMFGSLTAYVFISKKDFSFLGGLLMVGIIGLVLGGLVNMFFFQSPITSYLMAWGTLLIFAGYVLYDTSNIMLRYDSRGYCSAALSLFLDFINMFLAVLRILMGSRR